MIQTWFARSRPRRRFPAPPVNRSFETYLVGLGTLALLGTAGCGTAAQTPPERVVLVTIDTLRADHVGCYGAIDGHTPQLDAVGGQGVRFAAAISPAPLTLPAHASLMTALDPPGHGVRHNSIHRLDETLPTLAERMRAAGYATAAFVGAVVLAERFGLGRGFEVYDDDMGARISGVVGYAERRADRVVDASLAWVREAPARFFLWVHFYDPHAKYDPPSGFASAFASRPYVGEIAFVDTQLGRLIAGIEERWSAEGLLLVVTSDHGESLDEHGEATHSYTIYDATQRVPLVMRGAGLPVGRVIEAPVRLIDVAPTVLGLVGAEPLPETTGQDLRPLIAGAERGERVAYVETLATQIDYRWSPLLGLRTARFKYIRAPRPELYDLEADPGETSNLASDEPDRVAAFDRVLEERLVGTRPVVSAGDLSPAERERLQSLGYVVPKSSGDAETLGRVGGPDPKDEIGLLRVVVEAQSLLSRGRALEALAKLEGAPAAAISVASLRAAAAVTAGRYEKAEAEARAVVTRDPRRDDVWIILGRALEGQGKLLEAQQAFDEATRIDPQRSVAWTGLGRALEGLGRSSEAEAAYERARTGKTGNAEPTWRLAALRLESDRVVEAEALLASLPPSAAAGSAAALRLAEAEIRAGRTEAAARRLAAAHAAHPEDPVLALAAADRMEQEGQLEAALRAREAALAREPDSPVTANAVAWTLALLGRDLDRALELARRAVAASVGEPHVQDTLATVLLARGDAAGALQAVETALPDAPTDLRGHLQYLRAAALADLGESRAARRAVADSLAAGGDADEPWLDEARRLQQALGP
jgi:choline-sulfatase